MCCCALGVEILNICTEYWRHDIAGTLFWNPPPVPVCLNLARSAAHRSLRTSVCPLVFCGPVCTNMHPTSRSRICGRGCSSLMRCKAPIFCWSDRVGPPPSDTISVIGTRNLAWKKVHHLETLTLSPCVSVCTLFFTYRPFSCSLNLDIVYHAYTCGHLLLERGRQRRGLVK